MSLVGKDVNKVKNEFLSAHQSQAVTTFLIIYIQRVFIICFTSILWRRVSRDAVVLWGDQTKRARCCNSLDQQRHGHIWWDIRDPLKKNWDDKHQRARAEAEDGEMKGFTHRYKSMRTSNCIISGKESAVNQKNLLITHTHCWKYSCYEFLEILS